jgi:hypothetical protein
LSFFLSFFLRSSFVVEDGLGTGAVDAGQAVEGLALAEPAAVGEPGVADLVTITAPTPTSPAMTARTATASTRRRQ